ncbi:MAG TPA: hypothetical protein VF851_00320 [Steroidobacteraceae bacterium]
MENLRSPDTGRDRPHPLIETRDFSLVLGGPLFQLLRRTHLSDDALDLVRRRVVVIALLAWLPLFLLNAAGGRLLGTDVAVPFLIDLEVHVKFLVALPLLVIAELVVHQRMRSVARTFRDRDLVPEAAMGRLEAAVAGAYRLRNSVFAEIALIGLVYVVGVTVVWRHYVALDTDTWYAIPGAGGSNLTLAGAWYGYVSLPLFQFLLCRWYFRVMIWAQLLWRVSRIELSLVPTHPDRVGGLGFLANTVYAFYPLLLAHGALLSGTLASQIFHMGARLTDFHLEILLLLIFLLLLVTGPLMVFGPQLARAKRTGLLEYGTLAQRYVRDFDGKWLRGKAADDEQFVGSADIQSLADLGNSLEIVRGMRIVPISKEAVLQLGVVTLIPLAPLLLTLMPLEDLLKKLLGIVF